MWDINMHSTGTQANREREGSGWLADKSPKRKDYEVKVCSSGALTDRSPTRNESAAKVGKSGNLCC